MAQQNFAIVATNTVTITEYIHRLIEISIIRTNRDGVLDNFTSLVNPRCTIPKDVVGLTGIDQAAVRFEPVFCEVAEEVLNMLDGAILVSHGANFDYRVIRSEFKTIGYKFSIPVICISKLANKILPNLSHYHLGYMCNYFNLPAKNLNRAEGKSWATGKIYDKLIFEGHNLEDNIKLRTTEDAFHQKMHRLNLHTLEKKPGVYYFKDNQDNIIYVGKALKLRDRVKSHFKTYTEREMELCSNTAKIDFLYTGSNLIAELLESDEITKHKPRFNIAQKKETTPFIIVFKENKKGYLQLSIIRKDYSDSVNEVFYNRSSVAKRLMEVCAQFNLCPKYCGFHRIQGKCNHELLQTCPEACIGEEPIEIYNKKVHNALEFLSRDLKNFAVKLNGRRNGEMGFVLVRNGVYLGFGFVGMNDQIASPDDFENYITRKTHSYHTTRIIEGYVRKPHNKSSVIHLD